MRVAGQPEIGLARQRHRLAEAVLAPLPIAAAGAVVAIGCADSWRLALLAGLAASAVAAARFRGSGRAALGLLLVATLLALGGWGPDLDRRPLHEPTHHFRAHGQAHAHNHHRRERS